MDLTSLKRGDRAVVRGVGPRFEAPLAALGIVTGGRLAVLKVSPRRQTFLVWAGGKIILAREVAREVQIWKI